jgi:hypothetical protein
VNKDFQTFVKEMDAAAEQMGPSAERLSAAQWTDALPPEQRALQHLLRAESVFRRIQVSFGRQAGGGGGGGSESRDLAEMFDLELDAQKNQYETRQQASSSSASRTEVDELQRRLRELAQRQEDAANAGPRDRTTPESRWRQQVLRREIEELMRELQQAQQRAQAAQQGAAQNATPGGQQTGPSRAQPDASGRRPPSSAASPGGGGEESSPQPARTGEALDRAARRLEEAAREMRTAEQAPDASERAAAEARARRRLREAEDVLASERQQQRRADGTRGMDPAEAERALESLQRARDRLEELRARARRPAPGGSDQPGADGERAEAGDGASGRDGREPRRADGSDGQAQAQNQGQGERPGTNGRGGGRSGRDAAGRAGGRGGLTGAEAERLTRQALDDLSGAARTIGDDDELGGDAGRVRDEIRRLGTRPDLGRNPELLDRELEALLRATDPIEDRLRQRLDVAGGASVRTLAPAEVPPENRDAVAEYYRRLSETKPTAP